MKVCIINSLTSNIYSISGALEKLNHTPIITNDPSEIKKYDKFIFPGVGAFKNAMQNIDKLNLKETLNELVLNKKKPILGICLGFQIMCSSSTEFGFTNGLNWIVGDLNEFKKKKNEDITLHIGWNAVNFTKGNILFEDIENNSLFYFVHKYFLKIGNISTIALSSFNEDFTSVINKDNIFGVQFHPEKSQKNGLKLLNNFITKT